MASGNDVRIGAILESTYGVRVAPTRFFEITDDNVDYTYNKARSAGLGGGRWRAREAVVNSGGSGTLVQEVPSKGFGYWLNLLHGNTVTPAQQGVTTAYLQTHTLDTAVSKSITIQKQTPPVSTSTLLPLDYVGTKVGNWEFSISPDGFLIFTPTCVVRELQTSNGLATYTAPSTSNLFTYLQGSITIGGTLETNVIGDVTVSGAVDLRDDAFTFGSAGLMKQPVEQSKPSATGTFTADFEDLTNLNRVVNATNADVVIQFTGPTIASTFHEQLTITIPNCSFSSPAPQVSGPGPVQQTVTFTNASSAGNPVVITYMSTDTVI